MFKFVPRVRYGLPQVRIWSRSTGTFIQGSQPVVLPHVLNPGKEGRDHLKHEIIHISQLDGPQLYFMAKVPVSKASSRPLRTGVPSQFVPLSRLPSHSRRSRTSTAAVHPSPCPVCDINGFRLRVYAHCNMLCGASERVCYVVPAQWTGADHGLS